MYINSHVNKELKLCKCKFVFHEELKLCTYTLVFHEELKLCTYTLVFHEELKLCTYTLVFSEELMRGLFMHLYKFSFYITVRYNVDTQTILQITCIYL